VKILITGVAGFIGFSLAKYLSENTNHKIVGIDNLNDYYDVKLKEDRLKQIGDIVFYKIDLNDDLQEIFDKYKFDVVINLAAQAGVRYAKENPDSYIRSNISGFYNLIKVAQQHNIKKFIYASSSSVYGTNTKIPSSECDKTSTPMSIYAATKLANESIASAFFYSYGLPTIGLRFFSVYGPWGRPDMAYYKWVDALSNNKEVELYNLGEMWRDMTYIDDVTIAISKIIDQNIAAHEPIVLNIGNKTPVKVGDVLSFITREIGVSPKIVNKPKLKEEVDTTYADTSALEAMIGFSPDTNHRIGLRNFIRWYYDYNEKK